MAGEEIRVEGLREFVRGLKQVDSDLPKAARLANNKAADIVVGYAKPKVPRGPGKGGHVVNTIKAKSTRTAARVSGGGKKFPYYGWLDFGGRVGRNRSVRRPFMQEGRYIWRAYADHSGEAYRVYIDALLDVARQAGIEVEN